MSLGLTFLNSSTNQYQTHMVYSMLVGKVYNLLKETNQDSLETPPCIFQPAFLGRKCDSVRLRVRGSVGAWGEEECGA